MTIINERHISTSRAGDAAGSGNYSSLMEYLNSKYVQQMPFESTNITVSSSNVTLVDDTVITGNLAIDNTSVTTNGGVHCTKLAGAIGTGNILNTVDSNGAVTNLVEIRDAISHDSIFDSNDRVVQGLLQTDSTTADGDSIGSTGSENVQISFVVLSAAGTYTLTEIDSVIEISICRLYSKRHQENYRKVGNLADREFGASSGGAEIFCIDITNDGDGIVGDKQFLPDTIPVDKVITEALTDDDTVEIHFMVEGGEYYSPVVTVDGTTCTNLQQYAADQRLFYGSVSVVVVSTRTIVVESNTGSSTSVIVNRAGLGPEIISINFLNGYPGIQTEVKENDTYDIEVHFEPTGSEPTHVQTSDFGAVKDGTYDLSGTELNQGTVHKATITITIDGTSNTSTLLPARAMARNSLGTYGSTVDSNTGGSVDGTDVVLCNDVVPTFADGGTTYPASQSAFKGTETGTQSTTVSNHTNVTYSSPNGDFNISNPSTYAISKSMACTNPGTYNDTVTNFRIVATRSSNATQATFNKVIEVADIAPNVTVTQPQARLRTSPTGTNYTITATSNQNLSTAPDINIPVSGTQQGGTFVGGAKVQTRSIQLIDGDTAGDTAQAWQSSAPTNNAGLSATISGNENVGGFVSRVITLPAFGTAVDMTTEVTDTSKLTLDQSFKPGMVFQTIGTVPPVVNGWTIDAIGSNPTEIEILDTAAASSSSQASTLTIEESI